MILQQEIKKSFSLRIYCKILYCVVFSHFTGVVQFISNIFSDINFVTDIEGYIEVFKDMQFHIFECWSALKDHHSAETQSFHFKTQLPFIGPKRIANVSQSNLLVYNSHSRNEPQTPPPSKNQGTLGFYHF